MDIIYPMFYLVVLTFVIGFGLGIARFSSVKKGQVERSYFKLLSGPTPPAQLVQLANNYSNLLEITLLFYVLGVILLVLKIDDPLLLGLAWAFVALRTVHSAIHVTYNNPIHRFLAFFSSCCIILIMWIKLIVMIS